MTGCNPMPKAATLVAIDIAKDYHDVLVQTAAQPGRRRRFRVANRLTEYQRLAAYLRQSGTPVVIGFEATGNYHRTLAYFSIASISSCA